jgi:hypothetical protein
MAETGHHKSQITKTLALCYVRLEKRKITYNDSGKNQSTEGAEFVCVSECPKGEGCEIINIFVFV